MYLCNFTALALGLEGTPDPPLKVVQDAVTKYGYTGYVCPEYVAPPTTLGASGTDVIAPPEPDIKVPPGAMTADKGRGPAPKS